MSPPTTKATDDEVFAAAQRAMARRGPAELTLADIAAEAGVTAGRLVQRFGSKRRLMLALSERFAGGAGAMFGALRTAHASPLGALRAYVECMAGMASSPAALGRSLAYLHLDLTDAAFRGHLVAHARDARREIERLIRRAVEAGELSRACSPPRLARAVETTISGSLMTWACYQQGPAEVWLRRDLDATLAPYRPRRRRRS